MVSDLTKWEQAEVVRERAIRALRMVNACADVIIHATDEAGMLAGVCEAIAAVDGYDAIWIGPSDKVAPEMFCPFVRSGKNHEHKEDLCFIQAEPTPGSKPVFRGICPHSAFALRDGQIQPARGIPRCVHATPTIRSA